MNNINFMNNIFLFKFLADDKYDAEDVCSRDYPDCNILEIYRDPELKSYNDRWVAVLKICDYIEEKDYGTIKSR